MATSSGKTGCSKQPAAKKATAVKAGAASGKRAAKKATAAKKVTAKNPATATVTRTYQVRTDRWGNEYLAVGGNRIFFKNIDKESDH